MLLQEDMCGWRLSEAAGIVKEGRLQGVARVKKAQRRSLAQIKATEIAVAHAPIASPGESSFPPEFMRNAEYPHSSA